MKPLHVILAFALVSLTAWADEVRLPAKALPEQLAGKIVDANGHRPCQAELAQFEYFVFYVSASYCGPCKPITKKLITFYSNTGRKTNQVAFILIGRDSDRERHNEYVKNDGFPFFTSYWQDMTPLRTQFQAFWYWRGATPYLYMLRKDGSCVISQHDWNTDQEALPEHTLRAIEQRVETIK
jgi:hypothetical protein